MKSKRRPTQWPSTLSDRVIAFFTANPDEELSALDISLKYGVPADDVPWRLRRAVESGALRRVSRGGGPGSYAVFAAGSGLLAFLGLTAEACVPDSNTGGRL